MKKLHSSISLATRLWHVCLVVYLQHTTTILSNCNNLSGIKQTILNQYLYVPVRYINKNNRWKKDTLHTSEKQRRRFEGNIPQRALFTLSIVGKTILMDGCFSSWVAVQHPHCQVIIENLRI